MYGASFGLSRNRPKRGRSPVFFLAGGGFIAYNPPVSDCLFCKIARKEIPAQVVYDKGDVLAFKDIHPQAPVHVLIIPKKHVENVLALSTEDVSLLGEIQRAAVALADQFSVRESGFRLVVNNGSDAGQAVAHLHTHFLAGRPLGWPPG